MTGTQETAASAAAMPIKRIGVLGAGVMGAQIAAHCANAGLPVLLFDLPSLEGGKSAIATRAIAQLGRAHPAPLALPECAALIEPANYEDDLARLGECDLIIEAVAERVDIKRDLYHKIAGFLAAHAVLASNTSGLSIQALSQALPEALRPRFCGVHFFNPPRYMPLVEIIPAVQSTPALLDRLETFLVSMLGKSVVRARDTPNFIGNRIGVFGILATMIEAEKYGLSYEQVDTLTGTLLGRAKSGTFRTADVVGLDTLAHVIGTMRKGLPDDPFAANFETPKALEGLIAHKALGQKTGAGFYRKEGKQILRLDPASGQYVAADAKVDDDVVKILSQRDPAARLRALRASPHPQARFVWAVLRDTFHYSAVHLAGIAQTARDVDQAMRWGFGHERGPFEIWQAAGWADVAEWIQQDIDAGEALSDAALPDWVAQGPVPEAGGVHGPDGSWNPQARRFEPRAALPVYARQLFPPRLQGEPAPTPTTTVFEDDDVRLWTVDDPHRRGVLIVSFKTKMHTIGAGVTAGLMRAVSLAEAQYRALVIWQDGEPFSAGADLKSMFATFQQGGIPALEAAEKGLQEAAMRLRYAQVPTVAAVAGLALGGGCELAVHSACRIAHIEAYIGLVEAGIGLVPGAGGLTYCARRAARQRALAAPDAPLLGFLKKFAEAVAGAKVSGSALQARQTGFLRESDPIVMNAHELLYAALAQAQGMADAGWRPPVPQRFPVAGRDGCATLTAELVNLRDGGFISDYDFEIGRHIANVLCGGDVDPETLVDEAWILALERQAFLALAMNPKTHARIAGLLKTGKPVRN